MQPCKTEQGCWIPPVSPAGRRVLILRSMIHRLGKQVDPGTICRTFEQEYGKLTWDDLELLAAVEDLQQTEQAQGGDNAQ